MSTPEQSNPSLADEQRDLTRSRIRKAAMEVVARRGFDATVDEIAELSGVSPRTVFRHYASHDRLIAATIRDMLEACGLPRQVGDFDSWLTNVPLPADDLDSLIEFVAVNFHTRSAEIMGAAFWDLHARAGSTGAYAEVHALRREYRLRGMEYLVRLVWQVAGGTGEPPADLTLAFALNLSGFATRALMVDFDQTPALVGSLTADILKRLVRRALAASAER